MNKPKPQSEEYKAFESLLGKVLSVSKAEISQRIEQEKRQKRSNASRVSAVATKKA